MSIFAFNFKFDLEELPVSFGRSKVENKTMEKRLRTSRRVHRERRTR